MTVIAHRPAVPDEFCFRLHEAALGEHVASGDGDIKIVMRSAHPRVEPRLASFEDVR